MHDEVDIHDRDLKPIALGRHALRPAAYHGKADGVEQPSQRNKKLE